MREQALLKYVGVFLYSNNSKNTFLSYQIFRSSEIYFWTDVRKLGIYTVQRQSVILPPQILTVDKCRQTKYAIKDGK